MIFVVIFATMLSGCGGANSEKSEGGSEAITSHPEPTVDNDAKTVPRGIDVGYGLNLKDFSFLQTYEPANEENRIQACISVDKAKKIGRIPEWFKEDIPKDAVIKVFGLYVGVGKEFYEDPKYNEVGMIEWVNMYQLTSEFNSITYDETYLGFGQFMADYLKQLELDWSTYLYVFIADEAAGTAESILYYEDGSKEVMHYELHDNLIKQP